MKLYATIQNNEKNIDENVVLCQFLNKDKERCFVEETEIQGIPMFKVVVDEGYCRTEYYYPIKRYSIKNITRIVE